MAKFIKIGNDLMNLDSVAFARLNFDGRGAVALQLSASNVVADLDRNSMSVTQLNAVSATVRIYRDRAAKRITALLLDAAESLDDTDENPAV